MFHPLGNLSQQAAALALSVPAEKSGKAFTAKSLELAAQASGGYPFAVQLVGFNVWKRGSRKLDWRRRCPACQRGTVRATRDRAVLAALERSVTAPQGLLGRSCACFVCAGRGC